MEDTIDDFQLQIDTDPLSILWIVTVTSNVTVCLFVTVASGKLGMPESSLKIKHFWISSNPGMASLLNNLADKLDAADNNTTEPDDPTSADVDTDDSLVDLLTEGEDNINRDRSTLTIRRQLQDVAFELYLIL